MSLETMKVMLGYCVMFNIPHYSECCMLSAQMMKATEVTDTMF